MAYRSDRDADQARVASLEDELATAQRKIAELEGRQALVPAGPGALEVASHRPGAVARWLGAPLTRELTRRFEGAYPADRFEELVALIRSTRNDRGFAEVWKTSVTWTASGRGSNNVAPQLVVSVAVEAGHTTLTVRTRLHQVAGGIYGGLGGGVGGGGIVVPLLVSLAHPALAPVIGIAWLGGVLILARTVFRPLAARQVHAAQGLFDQLAGAISRTIASVSDSSRT